MKASIRLIARTAALLGVALLVGGASPAVAQAPTAGAGAARTAGAGILHLNVSNLDTSLALYRDILGMEVTTPPREPRANPGLVSEPGAMMRTVILKQPNGAFSLELVEWRGTALKAQRPRIHDAGEIMLALSVRDLDAKLAAAKAKGLKVLTRNGEPFVNEGRNGARNRAVMVQDPDGFVVEFTDSTAPNPNAVQGPIGTVAIYVTVKDLAKTVAFYNTVFGLNMAAPTPASPANERMKALFNETGVTAQRAARGTFPGSDLTINFQEFTGPTDGKTLSHRVQDPGGPIFLVTVQDFKGAIDAVRANGGIIGVGDTSVTPPADARASWVRDPNGVLLRLSLPAPPAGGPAPSTAAR